MGCKTLKVNPFRYLYEPNHMNIQETFLRNTFSIQSCCQFKIASSKHTAMDLPPAVPIHGPCATDKTVDRAWQRYRAIGGLGGRGETWHCQRIRIQRKIRIFQNYWSHKGPRNEVWKQICPVCCPVIKGSGHGFRDAFLNGSRRRYDLFQRILGIFVPKNPWQFSGRSFL